MKTLIHKLYVIFSMLFISQIVCAQITGKVVDAEDNYPLEYASIALFNASSKIIVSGVVTNKKGVFAIENIKPGAYYAEISFLGYQLNIQENITVLKTGESISLGVIKLVLGSRNELNEVIVTSEKQVLSHKIDRQVFSTKKFLNTVGGNAIDVIKNLPSVTTNGLGEITVRGSTGFTVLINGKPTQGDPTTILNQLPANALETVELITAPSAKYDPEGKGGILNIITKKGATNGTFAQVNIRGGFPSIENYNTQVAAKRYGIDATVNKRTKDFNFSFGTSYQRNDRTGRREGELFIVNTPENKTTFLPSDGERSFDEISYNGRFNVDYTPNESDVFSVGFFAGKQTKDRLADIVYSNYAVSPINSNNRLYNFTYFNHNLRTRKGDFALGSIDYAHKFVDNSKISASFLYEYTFLGGPTENDNLGYPDNTIVYQREFNTNNNPLYGSRFNLDYQLKPLKIGLVEMGYQYRNLEHSGTFIYERDGVLVPEFSSEINLTRKIHSGYTQVSGAKNKLSYNAGVRLEAMDRVYVEALKSAATNNTYSYNFLKLFPTASLQYKIDAQTSLKTAYSKRVERTTTFKMNSFAEREHSEVFEQGDNTLLPEFIDLVELGITKNFKKGNTAYATLYYRHVDNVINRVNTLAYEENGMVIDSVLNRVYSNVGKSNTVGIELGATLKPSKNWTNFIGANIYNTNIEGVLNFKHRDGIERAYAIQTNATMYSINLNTTYRFWENASLQFTFNYLSDRTTAMGQDSRFYSPNLTFVKSFFDNKLLATLQWQNMDAGLLKTNEQRITTARANQFYTTTNYRYEVDMISLNLSYTFNKSKNKSKFIKSEFGKREF